MFFIDKGIKVLCHLNLGYYNKSGNVFIDVIGQYEDGDAEFCSLTTMPKNEVLPYGYGYLNPMFPRGEKFIEQNNLGEPTGRSIWAGVNECIEYLFYMDTIAGDDTEDDEPQIEDEEEMS